MFNFVFLLYSESVGYIASYKVIFKVYKIKNSYPNEFPKIYNV